MQAIIDGTLYEVSPEIKVIIDRLKIENAELKQRENELKRENARLEESFQKATGVIAATDCVECKNNVYRKAYNDVMKIRASIQEIIEDVRKKDGGVDNE